MNAKQLIELLNNLTEEQKEMDIVLINSDSDETENIWLQSFEISNHGDSGYEVGGEIRLIGCE
jgi:hypothetical protein